MEENSFSTAERSKKQRLVVSVRGKTKQAKAAVLACFAGCSLLQTTQEESLSFSFLSVRVLLQRRNSMGMGLFYTLTPSLSFPPPSSPLHHLLV
jgi:hypothetical protein